MKKVVLPLVISSLSVSSCFAMPAEESGALSKPTQNQVKSLVKEEAILFNAASVWGGVSPGNQTVDSPEIFKNEPLSVNSSTDTVDTVQKNNTNNDVLTNPWNENNNQSENSSFLPAENAVDAAQKNSFNSSFLSDENAVDDEQDHTNNMIDPRNGNDDQADDTEQETDTEVNDSDNDDSYDDIVLDNPGRSRATAVRVALTGGVTVAVLAYCGWKVFGNSSRSEKTLFTKIAGKLGQNSGKASPVSIIFQFIKSKAEIVAPKLNRVLKKVAAAAGNAVYTGILALPSIVAKGVKISFKILRYLVKQAAVLFGY